MKAIKTLNLKMLTFDAAHYLPGHEKCGCIHGHTYTLSETEVLTDEKVFVDFNKIREVVDEFDHKLLVPAGHRAHWETPEAKELLRAIGCYDNIIEIPKGIPLVENIVEEIHRRIKNIPGVLEVVLELYEGMNAGISYVPDLEDVEK